MMEEQKYYIGLKSLLDEDVITDFLWEDHRFYPCFEKPSYAITKSELAKIQNGALYREFTKEFLSDSSFKTTREWINPMIKLIPVMGVL